jgi:ElaB/YqjD/DUF883 family membrane-anchored ribosome-binding protein
VAEQPNVPTEEKGTAEKTEAFRKQIEDQAREVTKTFERARRELTDAVGKLRKEVEQLDIDETAVKVRKWVQENPLLATGIAVVGGVLIGRVLASALKPPPPPPPWPVRMRLKAQKLASDTGELLSGRVLDATEALAHSAAAAGGALAQQAKELGEVLSERAEIIGRVGKKTAGRAAETLKEGAIDLTETVQESARRGFEVLETAMDAAKTVLAAVLIKKIGDWTRRVR